jgi:hypothetical protein
MHVVHIFVGGIQPECGCALVLRCQVHSVTCTDAELILLRLSNVVTTKVHRSFKSQLYFVSLQCVSAYIAVCGRTLKYKWEMTGLHFCRIIITVCIDMINSKGIL